MILLKKDSQDIVIINSNDVACIDTIHRMDDYIITIIFKSGTKKDFEFYSKKRFNKAYMNLIEGLTK
jgi:hypothetical protein